MYSKIKIWANVTKFGQNFIAPPKFFGLVRVCMEDNTIQSKQSYTKKCSDSQYFVWPPLFLITTLIPFGIFSIKLWQYSLDISFTQTSFIAFTNSAPLAYVTIHTSQWLLFRHFIFYVDSQILDGI